MNGFRLGGMAFAGVGASDSRSAGRRHFRQPAVDADYLRDLEADDERRRRLQKASCGSRSSTRVAPHGRAGPEDHRRNAADRYTATPCTTKLLLAGLASTIPGRGVRDRPGRADRGDGPGLLGLIALHLRTSKAILFPSRCLLPSMGALFPTSWLNRKVTERKSMILRDLPDTLDLLAISVEAGVGFEGALEVVCQNFTSPLADEFSRTLKEMELGLPREALQNLKRRTEVPELSNFVLALPRPTPSACPWAGSSRPRPPRCATSAVNGRGRRRQAAGQDPVPARRSSSSRPCWSSCWGRQGRRSARRSARPSRPPRGVLAADPRHPLGHGPRRIRHRRSARPHSRLGGGVGGGSHPLRRLPHLATPPVLRGRAPKPSPAPG